MSQRAFLIVMIGWFMAIVFVGLVAERLFGRG